MRYIAIVASLAGTLVFGLLILVSNLFVIPFVVCGFLVAVGVIDMAQTAHSLRRNYPIMANLRFRCFIRPSPLAVAGRADERADAFISNTPISASA